MERGRATNTHPTPQGSHRWGASWSDSDHGTPHLVRVLGVGCEMVVSGGRDERIASVAELQRGYVTRDQLRAVGVTDPATTRLIAAGHLVRVFESVYAVRPRIDVPLGRETAALLACSPNALLSYRSAASLWKLCEPFDAPVDVTISHRRNRQTPGIIVHRARRLLPRDIRLEQGLPVTSPARTLLDRASQLSIRDLERELDEALVVRRIVRRRELADVIARTTGHRGAPILSRLLGQRGHETITESEAERLFLALVREAGLPEPETQVAIAGYRVDFLWRKERVVFEIDGYRFHTSRRAFDRDRLKDQALKEVRLDPNRVSRDQVKHERSRVLAHVVRALARAKS